MKYRYLLKYCTWIMYLVTFHHWSLDHCLLFSWIWYQSDLRSLLRPHPSCCFLCFTELSPPLFPLIITQLSKRNVGLWRCVFPFVGFSSPASFLLFVAVGSLRKETNSGIQSARYTRYLGSGEWGVDVAVMGESRAYCVPQSPPRTTHTSMHPPCTGPRERWCWPLASDLVME